MAKEATSLITCTFYSKDAPADVGCVGDFVPPKRITGERAQMCPNCRGRIDAWSKRLIKDPDAAILYRGRLTLRSARMDNVLSHKTDKVVPMRKRRA
jgi:hypothetical protein